MSKILTLRPRKDAYDVLVRYEANNGTQAGRSNRKPTPPPCARHLFESTSTFWVASSGLRRAAVEPKVNYVSMPSHPQPTKGPPSASRPNRRRGRSNSKPATVRPRPPEDRRPPPRFDTLSVANPRQRVVVAPVGNAAGRDKMNPRGRPNKDLGPRPGKRFRLRPQPTPSWTQQERQRQFLRHRHPPHCPHCRLFLGLCPVAAASIHIKLSKRWPKSSRRQWSVREKILWSTTSRSRPPSGAPALPSCSPTALPASQRPHLPSSRPPVLQSYGPPNLPPSQPPPYLPSTFDPSAFDWRTGPRRRSS